MTDRCPSTPVTTGADNRGGLASESEDVQSVEITFETLLHFWFETLTPRQWFRSDKALDREIAERFGETLEAARRGELASWRLSPRGRLAEVITLDQLSRHIFRGDPRAFSHDDLALALARKAVEAGADHDLSLVERPFLYMPYMHSESINAQREGLLLVDQPGLSRQLAQARRHMSIIERFGRFPRRNAVLGRESSPEEHAFLTRPGDFSKK